MMLQLRRVGATMLIVAVVVLCAACTSSGKASSKSSGKASSKSSSTGHTASTAPSSSARISSSNAARVDAAFAARANRRCTAANAYFKAHPFPFPAFTPLHPTVRDLPAIGAYFRTSPNVDAQLLALGTPATGARTWPAVVSALRAHEANVRRQESSAVASDPAAFEATVKAFTGIDQRLYAAVDAAGFAEAAPACTAYYAD